MILVTGGSGSGKSAFAEQKVLELAKKGKNSKLVYIATMKVYSKEDESKVEKHHKLRAGKGFITLEIKQDIDAAPVSKNDIVLVECMSNLTANEMYVSDEKGCFKTVPDICKKVIKNIIALSGKCKDIVIVTNEVFSDGTVYDESTMEYIRQLGIINAELADKADEVYELVYSIPLKIK